VDEIAARTRDGGGVRRGWPAPQHEADAIDDAEYDLALLANVLRQDDEATRGTARYLLGANVHLARALRGAIDLVERHPRGRLRVTDHKTGKVRAKAGVLVGGGEILQPVLYALACERLLPEAVAAGRLYYCTATGGYEERIVNLDDRARAAAAEVVAIVDRALQAGFLPAAPAPRACEFCDYRPICGPYEEIRSKRKPVDPLHDLSRLRSMP
jgi:CRISPR/Cas system-associated exonuclease Cas4 (RecB family)